VSEAVRKLRTRSRREVMAVNDSQSELMSDSALMVKIV
jgi:hypothetical protein